MVTFSFIEVISGEPCLRFSPFIMSSTLLLFSWLRLHLYTIIPPNKSYRKYGEKPNILIGVSRLAPAHSHLTTGQGLFSIFFDTTLTDPVQDGVICMPKRQRIVPTTQGSVRS